MLQITTSPAQHSTLDSVPTRGRLLLRRGLYRGSLSEAAALSAQPLILIITEAQCLFFFTSGERGDQRVGSIVTMACSPDLTTRDNCARNLLVSPFCKKPKYGNCSL
jgi:hypothetical protein